MNGLLMHEAERWLSERPGDGKLVTGAWVGFDTSVTFGPVGHGLTSTDLYDGRGHVGRAAQTLLVRPR